MFIFVAKRIFSTIVTLLILIVISFILMRLAPGSPFTGEKDIPIEVLKNLEAKYGLDQPFYIQILTYVKNIVFHFDFGPSFSYKDLDVNQIVTQSLPVTFTYGIWSFLVAILVGMPLGIVAAVRQNTFIDYIAIGISIGAAVLPNFIMAPILIIIFTLWLDWLPGGGWHGGEAKYVIMPVIALSTSYMAVIARLTRGSMLEVLNSNFIRTAKAKGLSGSTTVMRHALKPALLPVLSYLGPAFVGMVTGSLVIDRIFSTGGMGQFFVEAALSRDYSLLMGITIILGTATVVFSTIVDILYAVLDPKIEL